MKHGTSSGQLQHCQDQEVKRVMSPSEDSFGLVVFCFKPQGHCLC